jgi:hypothetical protein
MTEADIAERVIKVDESDIPLLGIVIPLYGGSSLHMERAKNP